MGLSPSAARLTLSIYVGQVSSTAQVRQSEMGTGSVASNRLAPRDNVAGDGACPLFRRRGNAEKGDRHRGGNVSAYATPACATGPVPFFREPCAIELEDYEDGTP
jgi:hypothetical protein